MKPGLALSVIAVFLVLTSAPRGAAAQGTKQTVRFVPDVVGQFTALTQRADAMGFELYGPDPSQCDHMQSIVRVDAADGTPYFLVSRSTQDEGTNPLCEGGSTHSNIYIVKMGSRDKTGERLRSNRLARYKETTDTPPDPADKVVGTILFDGSSEWPHYDHPGAMQLVGNVMALALEAGQSGQPATKILFFDVSDPEHPGLLSNSFDPMLEKAGVVGITPCATGREGVNVPCATGHFLMLVSWGDNDEIRFFESNVGDLMSPDLHWAPLYTWYKDELVGGTWPVKHQTLHFIREGNAGGRLFLAGARAVGTTEGLFGDDYIDLYEVGFDGGRVVLTHRSTRHMISHPGGEGLYSDGEVLWGDRLASFAAASGFHVTPTGELLFYATEHDNDGPEGTNGRGSVKMGEWRNIDMFRPNSPAYAPTITAPASIDVNEGSTATVTATVGGPVARPWIELFESTGSQGRYVVIDQLDQTKDNFDDFRQLDRAVLFDLLRFNNRAASWRWFAPVSCTIRANDEPFSDPDFPGTRTHTVSGTGEVTVVDDLHSVLNNTGTEDMFRVVSSAQLTSCASYYSATMTPRWDVNFDGTTETVSNTVTISATENGPKTLELKVEAQHPIDGRVARKIIPVTVHNANPVIKGWTLSVGPGQRLGTDATFAIVNRPVTVSAIFTDAGRLDHQSASIDWGDGSVSLSQSFDTFTDAFNGVEGRLEARHTYAVAGVYTVRLSIIDDDGGVGQTMATITVVRPPQ